MWDPVSVFVCLYIMNVGLPDARLKVSDVRSVQQEHQK